MNDNAGAPRAIRYLAEKHRIRKVDVDGRISTIAYCENSTIALMIAVSLNATIGREWIFPTPKDGQ